MQGEKCVWAILVATVVFIHRNMTIFLSRTEMCDWFFYGKKLIYLCKFSVYVSVEFIYYCLFLFSGLCRTTRTQRESGKKDYGLLLEQVLIEYSHRPKRCNSTNNLTLLSLWKSCSKTASGYLWSFCKARLEISDFASVCIERIFLSNHCFDKRY